jgi:hypothetical protein
MANFYSGGGKRSSSTARRHARRALELNPAGELAAKLAAMLEPDE